MKATDLQCKVSDVYAKRSQLGVTIDKVKAAQQKPKKPANKYSKTEIKIANKISQWLQNNGFEEASKAIDCEFEL